MPGGIVHGLRQLRAKFVVMVPRLPPAQDFSTTPLVAYELDGSHIQPDAEIEIPQPTAKERYQ
jgi:hypothetical protein